MGELNKKPIHNVFKKYRQMNLVNPYRFGIPVNLITGLVAYYKAENNANDSLGVHNGTVTGATYSSGIIGNSFNFSTSPQYVSIPDSADFSFVDGIGGDLPFSISMWVYTTSYSAVNGNWLISKRNVLSGGDEWQLVLFNTGVLSFYKFDKVSNSNYLRTSCTAPSLNEWHHIVITDDGNKTLLGMKLYVDNIFYSNPNGAVGTYTGMANGVANVRIGLNNWASTSANFQHRGKIDEVGIWKNRELSQADVTELYNSGLGKTYPF